MDKIKRITKGGFVRVDVDGRGNWEVGQILGWDDRSATILAASDGEEIQVGRGELYKATRKEYEKAQGSASAGSESEGSYVPPSEGDEDKGEAPREPEDNEEGRDSGDLVGENCEEPGEEEEEHHEGGSIVKEEYKRRYRKSKSASGHASHNNGDAVAQALEGLTVEDAFIRVAEITGENAAEYEARWGHLNRGQQRMLVGNHLRKFYRDQERKEAEIESEEAPA